MLVVMLMCRVQQMQFLLQTSEVKEYGDLIHLLDIYLVYSLSVCGLATLGVNAKLSECQRALLGSTGRTNSYMPFKIPFEILYSPQACETKTMIPSPAYLPALAAPLGQPGTACRERPDTTMVIDMSETSSGRSWSLYGVTEVSGGEGSVGDRKSLLGCDTWRLAPHCSASSNSTINMRIVQGHEIVKAFLHGMYSILIPRRKSAGP